MIVGPKHEGWHLPAILLPWHCLLLSTAHTIALDVANSKAQQNRSFDEACITRLGFANWTQRQDLPLFTDMHLHALPQEIIMRAQMEYASLSSADFDVFSLEKGIVALPRARGPAMSWQHGNVSMALQLSALQVKVPSEHKINDTQFNGEIQLLHTDGRSTVVVVVCLLNASPRFKQVQYSTDCPKSYVHIINEEQCLQAATHLQMIKGTDATNDSVVQNLDNSQHKMMGCYATQSDGKWSLILDPSIVDYLSFDWEGSRKLCRMDSPASAWLRELVQRALNAVDGPACGLWQQTLFGSSCISPGLPLNELFQAPMQVLHYTASLIEMKARHGVGQLTLQLQAKADLGLSLGFGKGNSLVVTSIDPHGQVTTWNEAHPWRKVSVGDRIIAVNGSSGDPTKLLLAMKQHHPIDLTLEWDEVPACSVPLEWLVTSVPLVIDESELLAMVDSSHAFPKLQGLHNRTFLEQLLHGTTRHAVTTEAMASNVQGGKLTWAELFLPADNVNIMFLNWQFPEAAAAFIVLSVVLVVAGVLTWGLLRCTGEYEPDMVAQTLLFRWDLVAEYSVDCVITLAAVPLLLTGLVVQRHSHSLISSVSLPPSAFLYSTAAMSWRILSQLRHVWASGFAKSRVTIREAIALLVCDALAVVDVYLDIMFFCVSHEAGSPLCWAVLTLILVGSLGSECALGLLAAIFGGGHVFLHWQPRRMGLMHMIVFRHMLATEREDELQKARTWIVIPLLEVLMHDIPQLLVQSAFLAFHGILHPLMVLSVMTSATLVVKDLYLTWGQAKELQLGTRVVAPVTDGILAMIGIEGSVLGLFQDEQSTSIMNSDEVEMQHPFFN